MDEISDIIKLKPKKKKPILRNGSYLALQKIKLRSNSIIVTNTCAFDSLCQSLQLHVMISQKLKQLLKKKNHLFHYLT